jgi:hypothetical protein
MVVHLNLFIMLIHESLKQYIIWNRQHRWVTRFYSLIWGWCTCIDDGLAGKWFEKSGLPEGYYLASQQAKAFGAEARFEKLARHGHFLGHDAPWRKEARNQAGSGGSTGADLNLPWPRAFDGRQVPEI